MKGLNSFDKTGREYSLAPNDYKIRFWMSKKSEGKVTAGLSMWWQRLPRRRWVSNFIF